MEVWYQAGNPQLKDWATGLLLTISYPFLFQYFPTNFIILMADYVW